MAQWLKQSTAVTVKIGPFVDDTDGKTAETGLTLSQADIRLSKNGGNIAQKNEANAATHDELGYYDCALDTTDTDTLGRLSLMVHESGALPVWHHYMVVPANVWDSMFGADYLYVDTKEIASAAVSTSTAQIGINVVQISGDATAADNAEAFFDGTGYAGTNNVIPTVTTLTGHTAQTGDAFARLGAPAGASVSADIAAVKSQTAAIETDTQDLQTQIGTDGAGLTNMPWNAAWDAEVQSECADALAAYDPPTNAEMEARTILAANYFDPAADAVTVGTINTDVINAASIAADVATELNAAVLSAISGIGTAGGAAVNVDAETDNASGGIPGVTSGTTKVGTQTNTYASTSILDGTLHSIAHATNVIDWVYRFPTGAGTQPISIVWTGYFNPITKTITVQAWNHVGGAWQTIGTIAGQTGSSNVVKNFVLYSRHRGTSSAELGKVYLRFVTADGTTLATDQVYVSYAVTSRGTYSDGAVWINTNASNTNTQSYVDGLPENPVSTIAAAITVATNLNLKRYRVANGSAITLAADHVNRTMLGHGYTLAFGGQNVSGSYFEGVEGLSGTATCPSAECIIVDCHLNAITIGEADFVRCHLMNTVTMAQNSVPYRFHDCSGISSATIEFGGSSQSCVVSAMSGALTITGMASGDTLLIDGNGDLTLAASCTGGTVYIAGNIRLTNSGSGQTIYDIARWDETQGVDDTWDETIEGSFTARQIMRIFLAALAGISTGGGTATITFRDAADAKARITATVDANRNRTAITLDGA